MSGLEEIQNAGKEQMIDLLEARITVAESTMANLMAEGVYGNGTTFAGKSLTGLGAAVPVDPTTGTYGGIDATHGPSAVKVTTAGAALTASTIQAAMNAMWARLVRGTDRPDLIVMDNAMWALYMASLQAQQRFHAARRRQPGVPQHQVHGRGCRPDAASGALRPANTIFYAHKRSTSSCARTRRATWCRSTRTSAYAVNQDAEVSILAWPVT
jgi:hypothetical protein